MKGIMWRAESGLYPFAQGGAEQNAAVIPAPLVERHRLNAGPSQLLGNPQSMQNARRVRTNIDSCADFAERLRLLIDLHFKSSAQQRRRRGEAADPASYDRHLSLRTLDHRAYLKDGQATKCRCQRSGGRI